MANSQVNDIKKRYEKRKAYKDELKWHKKNLLDDTTQKEEDRKIGAVEYYKSLSKGEQELFKKELELRKVRDNYAYYLKYIFGENYKLTKFHLFLAKIAQSVVEKIEMGQKIRICLSVCPQHGKSVSLTETLPSWFLGRNPNLRCICTAYNADIAEKFGDRNREKVKKFGKEIFGIEVSETQDNKTLFNIKNKMGGLYSTGITGSLTSNQGALIIVDDPFKNGVEADNPSIRQQVWDIFCDSILTRQRGMGNGIIVIHTRWHDDDLIGRILTCETSDEWIYINIPCVHESGVDKYLHRKVGETLCPELGFDANWVESIRKTIGEKKFAALYQGKPYAEGGEIVKRENIKYYDKKTQPICFDELTLSCDLSFGGKKSNNDPCCMQVWGRVGGNHYLLDYINEKLSFTETQERIKFLCSQYPQMKKKLIESKANGNAVIQTLNKEIGGFVGFDPKSMSKTERLELVMPYFEAGNIYFPSETIKKDIEEYINQLLKFPKVAHDDFVDTITQYLLDYQYKGRSGGRVLTDNKYATLSKIIRGLKV